VLEAGEAADVAVAEVDLVGERVAERREVVGRAGLDPGVLAECFGAGHLGGEILGDADGLLEVAADPPDQARVVGVGVLLGRPRLERVEQRAERRVGLARVDDAREGRGRLGAMLAAGERHHRLLVPEQQAGDRVQVAELPHVALERRELLFHWPAREYTSSSSASASSRS
jgi:hypothetical protein